MLNLLSVALQGLTPAFKLTPIAIAVQGLIEQIQEEQRREDVRGSGKALAKARPRADAPLRPRAESDADLEALVRAQWELLEARQRKDKPDSPPELITPETGNAEPPKASAITPESGEGSTVKDSLTPALTNPKAPATAPAVASAAHAADEDDVALLLMLAEIA